MASFHCEAAPTNHGAQLGGRDELVAMLKTSLREKESRRWLFCGLQASTQREDVLSESLESTCGRSRVVAIKVWAGVSSSWDPRSFALVLQRVCAALSSVVDGPAA